MKCFLEHGARHAIEALCSSVRSQPEPAGVTREEVRALVAQRPWISIDVAVQQLTGPSQRPIDRLMVADILLTASEQKAHKAALGLAQAGRELEDLTHRTAHLLDTLGVSR